MNPAHPALGTDSDGGDVGDQAPDLRKRAPVQGVQGYSDDSPYEDTYRNDRTTPAHPAHGADRSACKACGEPLHQLLIDAGEHYHTMCTVAS